MSHVGREAGIHDTNPMSDYMPQAELSRLIGARSGSLRLCI